MPLCIPYQVSYRFKARISPVHCLHMHPKIYYSVPMTMGGANLMTRSLTTEICGPSYTDLMAKHCSSFEMTLGKPNVSSKKQELLVAGAPSVVVIIYYQLAL